MADGTKLTFGKHKGKTYLQVYKSDTNYCNWVMFQGSQPKASIMLKSFCNYLTHKDWETKVKHIYDKSNKNKKRAYIAIDDNKDEKKEPPPKKPKHSKPTQNVIVQCPTIKTPNMILKLPYIAGTVGQGLRATIKSFGFYWEPDSKAWERSYSSKDIECKEYMSMLRNIHRLGKIYKEQNFNIEVKGIDYHSEKVKEPYLPSRTVFDDKKPYKYIFASGGKVTVSLYKKSKEIKVTDSDKMICVQLKEICGFKYQWDEDDMDGYWSKLFENEKRMMNIWKLIETIREQQDVMGFNQNIYDNQ